MLKTSIELLKEEERSLASYSVKNTESGGRVFLEPEHVLRLSFQRDRDRILHCKYFRRLEYKTQVFINSEGDNYRTRLTHTLEVAGIARTIALSLGLNTNLAESIALAHDLGHAPFGHSGQDILSELMSSHGGFEHNKQSLRIVQKLENRYSEFSGLNLCKVTLIGIMKHGGDYEKSDLIEFRNQIGPPMESMIVDVADEIAYNNHDIDDGLESNFIQVDGLCETRIWKEFYNENCKQHKNLSLETLYRKTIRQILNEMVMDLVQNTENLIQKFEIENRLNLYNCWKTKTKIVSYSDSMQEKVSELKSYLLSNLYNHPEVKIKMDLGKKIIEKLFNHYKSNINQIPEKFRMNIDRDGEYRVIADYISGMTDRYAEQIYNKLS